MQQMIRYCLLCLASFALSAADETVSKPTVVSLNVCVDQLIIELADEDQILGLSKLAQDKSGSYHYKLAQALPISDGSSEQLLRLNPDVVIAGEYTTQHTVRVLRELGLRVEILPIANSVEQLLENLLQMGQWLQQPAKAQNNIEAINRRLDDLLPSTSPRPVAAVYDPNGYTVGSQTLRGDMLELAGWDNLAGARGITHYGTLSLETLIVDTPDAILESPYSPGTWSRAQRMTQHPALGDRGISPAIISVPSRSTICAGPWTLDVIERLQAERLALETQSQ